MEATAAPYQGGVVRDKIPDWLLDSIADKAFEEIHVRAYTLRKFSVAENYIYLWEDVDTMGVRSRYICVTVEWKERGRKIFMQKNVWQENARGFARIMMLDYFSRGRNVLRSDSMQRKRGAEMWKRFLKKDCVKRHTYLSYKGHLHNMGEGKDFLITSAYLGNAGAKTFLVSEYPILDDINAPY